MNVLLTGLYPQGVTGLAPFYLKAYFQARSERSNQAFIRVKGYDLCTGVREIVNDICSIHPDIVGFSCYIWNAQKTLVVCEALKKHLPHLIIILGGPEVSPVASQVIVKNPSIDVVVKGEGEITFTQLLEHYLTQNRELSEIDGIVFRNGDEIYSTNPRTPIDDLSTVPSPFLDNVVDFSQLKGYLYGFETFRGCPYHCNFCYWGRMQKIRFFPIERIEKELEIILNSSINRIWLSDSVANLKPSRFKRFLKTIINNQSKTIFDFEMVSELLDDETIDLLGQLHDGYIAFGLQSMNEQALIHINRAWNKTKFEKNIRKLRQRTDKIKIYIDLIYGLPGDNMESFMKSSAYALSLLPQKIQPHPLLILPGSPFFDEPERFGLVYNPEPPHHAISSSTFSQDDMAAATEWSNKLFFYFNPSVSTTVIMLSQILNHEPIDIFQRLLQHVEPVLDPCAAASDIGITKELAQQLFEILKTFITQELKSSNNSQNEIYISPLIDIISFYAHKTAFSLTEDVRPVPLALFQTPLESRPSSRSMNGLRPVLNSTVAIKDFSHDVSVLNNMNILKSPDQLLKLEKIDHYIAFNLQTHGIFRISHPVRELLNLCNGTLTFPQLYDTYLETVNVPDKAQAYQELDTVVSDLFNKRVLSMNTRPIKIKT